MELPENADAVNTADTLDAVDIDRIHQRTLRVVILSQILGGAGLAAGITVGALLAQEMLGSDRLAGLPTGLFTLGSALTAFLVGQSTRRFGRRAGLASGFLAGGLGAVGVLIAAVLDNPALLFVSLFIYGAGTATNLQARYAGADLAPEDRRGHGTSMAMVATTIGAVAGPNLVEPMGRVAESLGIPTLAGPFLLAAVAYAGAGVVLFLLLRPDPYLLAREIAGLTPAGGTATPTDGPATGHPAGVRLGAAIMILTQITMVSIMTMTPLHMQAHHHSIGAVGLVIGLHVGAMWLPSLVTGRLVDTVGRLPVAIAGGTILLATGALAALAPGDSLVLLVVALMLLGLGWNLGLVSGTAMVVDATVPDNRPQVQGTIDVFVAVAGAAAGLASGALMSAVSYQALAVVGGLIPLVLLPLMLRSALTARR